MIIVQILACVALLITWIVETRTFLDQGNSSVVPAVLFVLVTLPLMIVIGCWPVVGLGIVMGAKVIRSTVLLITG